MLHAPTGPPARCVWLRGAAGGLGGGTGYPMAAEPALTSVGRWRKIGLALGRQPGCGAGLSTTNTGGEGGVTEEHGSRCASRRPL